ncbi:Dual specificity phosphatase protein [Dioscorea alata]|uniref:Dual specificity phosphatase protein n=4 Tax=Dioscorea alata TaxID=55571 RepID=A0ACB7U160_DIOAL|nr:Dual specificity phosphatase protein [Dioscorea alata]KAH7654041.1 Dual specificity phosphatase protein [Dioscorea alata]KAH7654042.1 Dual specificity phosphatase protein [Dioscorea alata]KAH7654043.1 Dual specificity phosphatase protein [Dioscorea alata]
MGSVANGWISPAFPTLVGDEGSFKEKHRRSLVMASPRNSLKHGILCKISGSGTMGENTPGKVQAGVSNGRKIEDYNTAMKRMMRNPYEYHHDLGMNYTIISDNLIVGSQPQKPEDVEYLKEEEKVAYILCLQQDKDIEYWGIDIQAIVGKCKELGILHMRRPARDFDPDSLRSQLPKAVSLLEWAMSEGKGRVYVHCSAGLGRAPAVAIAYMFWFCDMDLNAAYNALTSKRPCGPNKRAIQGATYDLAKNDPWKEPFENLPEHAFQGVADWERKLIQERVLGLRGI